MPGHYQLHFEELLSIHRQHTFSKELFYGEFSRGFPFLLLTWSIRQGQLKWETPSERLSSTCRSYHCTRRQMIAGIISIVLGNLLFQELFVG